MPIQAASLLAQKRVLTDVDPSGETWVYVRPATGREHLRRGDLLRTSYSAAGVVSDTNPVLLAQMEIYLTCGGEDGTIGSIVVIYGEKDQREFFSKKKDEYTQRQFFAELSDLPISVFRDWHRQVITVNEEWTFPL
jgi:hypothetical protein